MSIRKGDFITVENVNIFTHGIERFEVLMRRGDKIWCKPPEGLTEDTLQHLDKRGVLVFTEQVKGTERV